MRFQLNTTDFQMEQCLLYKERAVELGCDLKEMALDNIPLDFSKKNPSYKFPWFVTDLMIAYVCPHCGSEMYGYWRFLEMRYVELSNYQMPERYHSKRYSYSNECGQFHRDFQNVRDNIRNILKNEIDAIHALDKCPCCGTQLLRSAGYYQIVRDVNFLRGFNCDEEAEYISIIPDYGSPERISAIFDTMKNQRAVWKQAKQQVEKFVALNDLPVIVSISDVHKKEISGLPSNLQEYLLNLIKLETNIYALTKRLSTLYSLQVEKIKDVFDEHSLEVDECLRRRANDIDQAEERYIQHLQRIIDLKAEIANTILPQMPQEPVYKALNVFNKKKAMAENELMKTNYQAALKAYDDEINNIKAEKERKLHEIQNQDRDAKEQFQKHLCSPIQITMAALNADVDSPATFAKNIIDTEIAETEGLLKRLYECRNGLYSYNIIFGKYRNVVALSTFYEYLMAGRCTTLEGADGAYNIYESEVRADRIIGQLSEVLIKLDDIKAGQYMIYSEMQQVNTNLNKLSHTMETALASIQKMEANVETITKNSELIAHNTAVTAYYSKVNAELTNALGYMVAFK